MAYDKDKDYQAEINDAVAQGDYYKASTLEKERNEKIDGEGLSYSKTYNYTMPNGVNGIAANQALSKFTPSQQANERERYRSQAADNVEKLVRKENIISKDVNDALKSQFEVPEAVTEADKYIKEQLEKIQSGKTSYSDQVKDMMEQIQNREKFSYDVDTDPLFQQALASAMGSGKQAMQDTIGQASALTGGYGSTYATSAGNQAYNSFIEDAYNNLPQYYQMAMDAYQMEGDEMYRQLGMLNDADAKEYERMLGAYDATYAHRNQLYNEAYTQFRDSKADAFAMANLQLTEHGQRVSDAYNYYMTSADLSDSLYEKEYNSWIDTMTQAMEWSKMLNSDYWSQADMDYKYATLDEDARQFDERLAKEDEWNQEEIDYKYADLSARQSMHGAEMALGYKGLEQDYLIHTENLAHDDKWNQADYDYKYAALAQDKELTYAQINARGSSGGGGGGSRGGGGGTNLKSATPSQKEKALKLYNSGDIEGYNAYMASLDGTYDLSGITSHVTEWGDDWVGEYAALSGATMYNDTKNGGFLWFDPGVDHDDVYEYTLGGTTYHKTYDEINDMVKGSSIPQEQKDKLKGYLQGLSKK